MSCTVKIMLIWLYSDVIVYCQRHTIMLTNSLWHW